ncbi:MAG TPA: tannase/feruloyl esterase family alpha/beta hydrolase [Jatrophihabitans sp.]|nr:tannase/feruloyl esterase family alpha/beta hydrolase [Jatrophihabitans sp.]
MRDAVPSFWQAMQSSSYISALDPDLTRFQQAGGKLLLWHGWGDQHISPQGTLAYYNAVQRTMGKHTVDQFLKLFMFPGVARYDGTGSTDDAANFVPYTPHKEPGPNDNWLGKRLFSSDYQTWCHADATQLVCRPKRTWLTAKGE